MAGTLVVWWVVLFALWLALVDTTQLAELVAGMAAAAVGAVAAILVRAGRPAQPSVDPRWLRHAGRPIGGLLADTALLLRALWWRLSGARRVRGEFRSISFRAGGEGRRDVARRALTETLGSVGPNTIVLGIDRDREQLVVHQLVRRKRVDLLELE